MTVVETVARARELYRQRNWREVLERLSAADAEQPLAPEDVERLATVSFLLGKDTLASELWTRAHQEFLALGETARAARCAFWLGFYLMHRGDHARSSGWLSRARRLVDESALDCVERGYLLIPPAVRDAIAGRIAEANAMFAEALATGERFGEPGLVMLGRLGVGRTLIRLGRLADGVALLDEVMVTITMGDVNVNPMVVGVVYCSVIEACHDMFDLRRAQEWTTALSEWCSSQPDLVPYRGVCLVRRAEIMQLHGAWPDAMIEARRAVDTLAGAPGLAAAHYLAGELYRLRGEPTRAEDAYRQASLVGRQPEPGLALLRLAQGNVDAAVGAIRRTLDETQDLRARSRLLGPFVEIVLSAGDVAAARTAADELTAIAADQDAPLLRAHAAHAVGAVLLAEGDARHALESLRRAWSLWQEIGAPYEAARVRVLVAQACRSLGDDDSAEMELDAARHVFESLGAAPDLARVTKLSKAAEPPATGRASGPLTARETQVLALVAAGKTNRAIADDLDISEKTVARHVSNIFMKLGLSSRAAATAYAFRMGVVSV